MIDVVLLSVIRWWYFCEGMLIREIIWRIGLSWNMVCKYLVKGVVEFCYFDCKFFFKFDDYELILISWLFWEFCRYCK